MPVTTKDEPLYGYLWMSLSSHASLRGRRLKGKGKGVLGARETRGAREEGGGRETPARKPLFSPSRLLIMYARMTSCQISLAAMRLCKSYFAYCFSFVFPKQEI